MLQISDAALRLFAHGQQQAAQRGLLLVDTKYEFGKDPEGTIRLIDEIHTPDSSRRANHFCPPADSVMPLSTNLRLCGRCV